MSLPYVRYLPPEIWREVFLHFNRPKALAHLWTWGRLVSRQFHDLMENVYATQWLPKIDIKLNLGSYYISEEVCPDEKSIEGKNWAGPWRHRGLSHIRFEFKCLGTGQDSGKAAWKFEGSVLENYPEIWKDYTATIAERMSEYLPRLNRFEARHFITLMTGANDTALPGLEWDLGNLELFVNWKAMYSELFGEEDAFFRAIADSSEGAAARLEAYANGLMDPDLFTTHSHARCVARKMRRTKDMDWFRRKIRRQALRRQYNRDPAKGIYGYREYVDMVNNYPADSLRDVRSKLRRQRYSPGPNHSGYWDRSSDRTDDSDDELGIRDSGIDEESEAGGDDAGSDSSEVGVHDIDEIGSLKEDAGEDKVT